MSDFFSPTERALYSVVRRAIADVEATPSFFRFTEGKKKMAWQLVLNRRKEGLEKFLEPRVTACQSLTKEECITQAIEEYKKRCHALRNRETKKLVQKELLQTERDAFWNWDRIRAKAEEIVKAGVSGRRTQE
jgi:hypothetical protein